MFKVIGFICAALIVCSIFGGYFFLRSRHAAVTAPVESRNPGAPHAVREPVKLHVLEDEAYLRRSDAVIGGTIRNVSNQKLPRLLLTVKLQSRDGQTEETRTIAPTPADLEPQESATYSIAVPSAKWRGAKVVVVASDGNPVSESFLSMRGKARPHAAPPPPIVRTTTTIERPKPTKKGGEFLNTPETAIPIR